VERDIMPFQWIIMGMHGVVLNVPSKDDELLVSFIHSINDTVPREQIIAAHQQACYGMMSSFDFWREMSLKNLYPQVEQDYLEMCGHLNDGFTDFATALSQYASLAILSNDVKEWAQHFRKKFNLEQYFKAMVFSGDVGCYKPEPAIYQVILEKLEVDPANCVFVDAHLEHLKTAAQLGFRTVRFGRDRSPADFRYDCEAPDFPSLRQHCLREFMR
jgi:HAD superfamily hydrolase (TIGR01509 family)